MKLFNYSVKTF